MCQHQPPCPSADAADRDAAYLVAFHPEQGWGLLCNGVVLFEDWGELLPDGRSVPSRRPAGREVLGRAA
ncbi:DUF5999 family protein [Sphaerimonospora sp. CA-214678]|uniref:DUF5999 family protein n=1 Tax=Sphaerimonospora sp. CA-214678 TaxID=3240029 RepID=UPI003D91A1F5